VCVVCMCAGVLLCHMCVHAAHTHTHTDVKCSGLGVRFGRTIDEPPGDHVLVREERESERVGKGDVVSDGGDADACMSDLIVDCAQVYVAGAFWRMLAKRNTALKVCCSRVLTCVDVVCIHSCQTTPPPCSKPHRRTCLRWLRACSRATTRRGRVWTGE
jgi:hypothetical protein